MISDLFVIDAIEKNAIDPVGCGDALLSYAALGLYHSNIALLHIVRFDKRIYDIINGNEPISLNEILKKLTSIESQLIYFKDV